MNFNGELIKGHIGNIVVDSIKSKNLFNKNTAIPGYLVSRTTGDLAANSSYVASDFIPMEAGVTFTVTNCSAYYTVCYNASKTYIGYMANANTMTTLANTKYIRTCFNASSIDINTVMVELGSVATNYEPFQNVEGQDYYSLNEIKIGTYVDAKPIYRKVYTGTTSTITNGYFTLTDAELKNISSLIRFDYYVKDGTVFVPLPNVGDRIAVTYIQTSYGGLGLRVLDSSYYSSFSEKPYTIILEYTKTTD